MNNIARWGFALALLPIAACSNSSQMMSSPPPAPPMPALADADASFASSVLDMAMFQTQISPYEAQNGRRAPVKAYASMLADAYTRNMSQMQSSVAGKAYAAPSAMSQPMMDMSGNIMKLKGAPLDRAYLHAEVVALNKSVRDYQAEIANGTDPDLKALAQSNLPTVQRQLARARALGGR